MPQNKSKGFLDLPVELRQHIYHYLFDGAQDAIVDPILSIRPHFKPECSDIISNAAFINPTPRGAQVLRICRQTFNEARPILIHQTHFILNPRASLDFFSRAPRPGTNRRYIRSLHIRLQEEKSPKLPITPEDFPALQHLTVTGHITEWINRNRNILDGLRFEHFNRTHDAIYSEVLRVFLQSSIRKFVDLSTKYKEIRLVLCNEIEINSKTKGKPCLIKGEI